jgi:hypothetical protein
MSEEPRGPMHSCVKMDENPVDSRMAPYVRTPFHMFFLLQEGVKHVLLKHHACAESESRRSEKYIS